jgi:hypothetical protein
MNEVEEELQAAMLKVYDFKDVDELATFARKRHSEFLQKIKDKGELALTYAENAYDVREFPWLENCASGRANPYPAKAVGLQTTGTCYVFASICAIVNCGDLADIVIDEIQQENDFAKNALTRSGKYQKVKRLFAKFVETHAMNESSMRSLMATMWMSAVNHKLIRDMLLIAVLSCAHKKGAVDAQSRSLDFMYAMLTTKFAEACAKTSDAFLASKEGGYEHQVLVHVLNLPVVIGHPWHAMKGYPRFRKFLFLKATHLLMQPGPIVIADRVDALIEHDDIMLDQAGTLAFSTKDSEHAVAYARGPHGLEIIDSNVSEVMPVHVYPYAGTAKTRVSLSLTSCEAHQGGGLEYARASAKIAPVSRTIAPVSRTIARPLNVRASSQAVHAVQEGNMYAIEAMLYLLMLQPYFDMLDDTHLADEIAVFLDDLGGAQGGGSRNGQWPVWAALAAVTLASSFA